ncbi:hypothetical protein ZIOFF_067699 [Zingiber officinale]|uniref:Uncharacterized protein n=1 Tax=Zingiber officinale TaxID=94328 RepID=A0A8J5C759_ZINOF|nr:hypothetical protein ZIOFF_067699 [Zingiber officinale]
MTSIEKGEEEHIGENTGPMELINPRVEAQPFDLKDKKLLPISSLLTSATDENDPTLTDYCLLITNDDVVMQWAATSQHYWSISSDARSIEYLNLQVAYQSVNVTRIYLLAGDQKTALFEMILPMSILFSSNGFHMAKLSNPSLFYAVTFPLHLSFLSFLFLLPFHSLTRDIATEFLYPNFYAAYINFTDNSGVFLSTSACSIAFNIPSGSDSLYYVVALHARSGAVVWTANPTTLMSSSSTLSLLGVRPRPIHHQSLARLVDTVPFNCYRRPPTTPSGELHLLDATNASLCTSFDYPSDMLLPNQLLPISSLLTSATDENDPTLTDYYLLITNDDTVMQWVATSQLNWSISVDARSIKYFNLQVTYLSINAARIYLLAARLEDCPLRDHLTHADFVLLQRVPHDKARQSSLGFLKIKCFPIYLARGIPLFFFHGFYVPSRSSALLPPLLPSLPLPRLRHRHRVPLPHSPASLLPLLPSIHSLPGHIATEFLYTNFYASYFNFTNISGVFRSISAFSISFNNPCGPDSRYYVIVLHDRSGAVIWIATPVSSSSTLSLTASGLALSFTNRSPA